MGSEMCIRDRPALARCTGAVSADVVEVRGHREITNRYRRPNASPPTEPPGGGCETMRRDMTAWLSVLVPLLVMFFALGMERVESRLRESTVRPEELEELLERPRPDEVRALFRQGTGRALELFRLRGKTPRRARPTRNKRAA